MRVTVSHNKTEQQVKDAVDHSLEQMFSGFGGGIVELSEQHRQWHGNIMVFSMTAKMGFIRTPIKGAIEVTATDVIVNIDLGLLEKLIPPETLRNGVEGRVRGFLT